MDNVALVSVLKDIRDELKIKNDRLERIESAITRGLEGS